MESDYLFPLPEIEEEILKYLDPVCDYKNLVLINKYYHQLSNNNQIFSEYKKFYLYQKNSHELKTLRILRKDKSMIGPLFLSMCTLGYGHLAKYFYEKYHTQLCPSEFLFKQTCQNNHIEIGKWLYDLKTCDISHRVLEQIFIKSCTHGYLEMAQWIYGLKTNHSYFNNRRAFSMACQHGHFDIIKWLWPLEYTISPYCLIQNCFPTVCTEGHLEIAQYLYEINPKAIRNCNERILDMVFHKGHIKMYEWLMTFNVSRH